ncbi:MAG: hypothetical protein HY902_08145 [Deltaproteobacteria bacterium]|nr:hypothetical protein [Deltaproteobacteria bacterium]
MAWTTSECRWRDALLAAVLPAGQRHGGVASLELRAFWSTFGRHAPWDLRLVWRLSVWLLTWWAVVRAGRPLHTLPPQRRERLLQTWAESPNYLMRQMVMLAKTIAAWALLADPGTRAQLQIR